jgi:hypothetical protein
MQMKILKKYNSTILHAEVAKYNFCLFKLIIMDIAHYVQVVNIVNNKVYIYQTIWIPINKWLVNVSLFL